MVMKQVMVRYKVKPELAQENERLVRAVYDELEQSAPAGLRYATFKLEDGVSFVHLASIETDDGHNPLQDIAAFKRFQANAGERQDEPAVSSEVQEIGSYRLFDQ
jgi:hypothetical protein